MSGELQQIQYLGPKLEVAVGGVRLDDCIVSFNVWSSRFVPGDIAEVHADAKYVDTGSIRENDPLTIRWGYKGFALAPIFAGLVAAVRPGAAGKRLKILGVDPMKRLFETRLTKTFQNERPTVILRNLLAPLGIDTTGVAEVETILDRLPLHDDHIVHAIRTLNRRLGLAYDFWFEVAGAFHWAPLSIPAAPAWNFVYGQDLIEFERRQGGARMTTIGVPARHGERVTVQTAVSESLDFWVAEAHHYQPPGRGFRTDLSLREVPA